MSPFSDLFDLFTRILVLNIDVVSLLEVFKLIPFYFLFHKLPVLVLFKLVTQEKLLIGRIRLFQMESKLYIMVYVMDCGAVYKLVIQCLELCYKLLANVFYVGLLLIVL